MFENCRIQGLSNNRIGMFENCRIQGLSNNRIGMFENCRIQGLSNNRIGVFENCRIQELINNRIQGLSNNRIRMFGSCRIQRLGNNRIRIFENCRIQMFQHPYFIELRMTAIAAYGYSRIAAYECFDIRVLVSNRTQKRRGHYRCACGGQSQTDLVPMPLSFRFPELKPEWDVHIATPHCLGRPGSLSSGPCCSWFFPPGLNCRCLVGALWESALGYQLQRLSDQRHQASGTGDLVEHRGAFILWPRWPHGA